MAVLKKSTANRDLALDLARSPTCFSLRSLWSVVDFCASKPILSQSKGHCGERVLPAKAASTPSPPGFRFLAGFRALNRVDKRNHLVYPLKVMASQ